MDFRCEQEVGRQRFPEDSAPEFGRLLERERMIDLLKKNRTADRTKNSRAREKGRVRAQEKRKSSDNLEERRRDGNVNSVAKEQEKFNKIYCARRENAGF